MDNGGGPVVNLLAFNSDDPSLNYTEVYWYINWHPDSIRNKDDNKGQWLWRSW